MDQLSQLISAIFWLAGTGFKLFLTFGLYFLLVFLFGHERSR